jgi:hypothetical protein
VRNLSGERVLAVISVDGVNVISGQTAAPDQTGYVIDPNDSVEVAGWRKDYQRTAAFFFTDIGEAYATRTGRPGNVGVIGVAAFREDVPSLELAAPAAEREGSTRRTQDAAAAPAANGAGAQPSGERARRAESGPLGTGHGRREYAPAREVEFKRRSGVPDAIVAVRYDSRERLLARGVLERPRADWGHPDPFPALAGFVPDP